MADEEHGHELIIVRRHEEEEHESHSSAWKVAHADFMTAMMAFFLIMWLINVTDDQVRKGISQYFNPIHLSEGSTDLKGLNEPDPSNTAKSGRKGPNEAPAPGADINPVKLTAGGGEQRPLQPALERRVPAPQPSRLYQAMERLTPRALTPAAGTAAAAAAAAAGGGGTLPPAGGQGTVATTAQSGGPSSGSFQDPYAALAQLAANPAKTGAASADIVPGDQRAVGAAGGITARDPFDPIYWQTTQLPAARSDSPAPAGTAADAPTTAKLDAAAASTAANGAASAPATASAAAPNSPPGVVVAPPDSDASPQTVTSAKAIAADIAKSVQPILTNPAPELTVKATGDGTLIGLTDDAMYSMFPVGSAAPDAKVAALMAMIADAIAAEPGDVIIRGYTDARPFHTGDNDNWKLSSARARAAYDLLIRAGLDELRVVSIEGHADRDPINPTDPLAAENRRIEILLKVPG